MAVIFANIVRAPNFAGGSLFCNVIARVAMLQNLRRPPLFQTVVKKRTCRPF